MKTLLYDLLKPRILYRPIEAFDIIPTQNTEIHKRIAKYANMMNKEYTRQIQSYEDVTNESINGGVNFDIIFQKAEWQNKKDLNTFSNIIVVNYSNYKFVFTGDNPKNILDKMMDENYMNIRSIVANATCLLAPHHGRTLEYSEKFFECVNPYISIVSDKSIVYGTQEDTARFYKGRGVEFDGGKRYVLTTRNDGTITITTSVNSCNISMDKEEY